MNKRVTRTSLVLLVCGITTYIAFLNPAVGAALAIGVAVAGLTWQILKNE